MRFLTRLKFVVIVNYFYVSVKCSFTKVYTIVSQHANLYRPLLCPYTVWKKRWKTKRLVYDPRECLCERGGNWGTDRRRGCFMNWPPASPAYYRAVFHLLRWGDEPWTDCNFLPIGLFRKRGSVNNKRARHYYFDPSSTSLKYIVHQFSFTWKTTEVRENSDAIKI